LHLEGSQPRILVVCYTNHALDQFLEDLIAMGIPREHMVRLGGKANSSVSDLALREQDGGKLDRHDWHEIDLLRSDCNQAGVRMRPEFNSAVGRISNMAILEYLEFSDQAYDLACFRAFQVPVSEDSSMERVGKKGKAMKPDYLYSRWSSGLNAGVLQDIPHVRSARDIWCTPVEKRRELISGWVDQIRTEYLDNFIQTGTRYNTAVQKLEKRFEARRILTLKGKRVIGCTTTGAAKYREYIDAAKPNILLVEEAGEILESHIITSLSSTIEQMVLIGDHKSVIF
jgi:hypothetical protein